MTYDINTRDDITLYTGSSIGFSCCFGAVAQIHYRWFFDPADIGAGCTKQQTWWRIGYSGINHFLDSLGNRVNYGTFSPLQSTTPHVSLISTILNDEEGCDAQRLEVHATRMQEQDGVIDTQTTLTGIGMTESVASTTMRRYRSAQLSASGTLNEQDGGVVDDTRFFSRVIRAIVRPVRKVVHAVSTIHRKAVKMVKRIHTYFGMKVGHSLKKVWNAVRKPIAKVLSVVGAAFSAVAVTLGKLGNFLMGVAVGLLVGLGLNEETASRLMKVVAVGLLIAAAFVVGPAVAAFGINGMVATWSMVAWTSTAAIIICSNSKFTSAVIYASFAPAALFSETEALNGINWIVDADVDSFSFDAIDDAVAQDFQEAEDAGFEIGYAIGRTFGFLTDWKTWAAIGVGALVVKKLFFNGSRG